MNSDSELIAFLTEKGYIDLDTIQVQIKMDKRKKYLDMHRNKVWQAASGYWYTELPPTKRSGRKLVKKKNKEDLENTIVDFYEYNSEKPTVEKCFEEWVAYKLENCEITISTQNRYMTEFNRIIKPDELAQRRIDLVTADELEEFIRRSIRKYNLTAKGYSGLRTVIMGIFKYAKKYKWTDLSISSFFGDLSIPKRSFTKLEMKEQIFNDEDCEKVTTWLREHPTVINYGLLLVFETGIRTGELAALKFEDIDGQWLNISRQEIRYRIDGKEIYEIVSYTKTDAGTRRVALPPSALDTIAKLKELNPSGEYIMTYRGLKVKKNRFNRCLYRACEKAGVAPKSMHKIRKTYGTMLINANVDESLVIKQMGHADITTTKKYYYYSSRNDEKKLQQIENAIMV